MATVGLQVVAIATLVPLHLVAPLPVGLGYETTTSIGLINEPTLLLTADFKCIHHPLLFLAVLPQATQSANLGLLSSQITRSMLAGAVNKEKGICST